MRQGGLGMRQAVLVLVFGNETLLAAFGRISSRLALFKVQRLYGPGALAGKGIGTADGTSGPIRRPAEKDR